MAKFCGQCGSLLNATALFCGGCGAKVPVAAAAQAQTPQAPPPPFTPVQPTTPAPPPASYTPVASAYAPVDSAFSGVTPSDAETVAFAPIAFDPAPPRSAPETPAAQSADFAPVPGFAPVPAAYTPPPSSYTPPAPTPPMPPAQPADFAPVPGYTPTPAAYTPPVQSYAPPAASYNPAPAAYTPAAAYPAKKSNTLVKVLIALVLVLFVGGALAVGGLWYAAQKIRAKVHAVKAQVMGGESPSTTGGLGGLLSGASNTGDTAEGFKGDPCRFLSKAEVSKAVGLLVIRTEAKDGGCSYIAKGDPADVTAKHLSSMLGGMGADPKTQQMAQKFAGGLFAQQEATDKSLHDEAATGEIPVLVLSFNSGNAAMEMKMNRAAFARLSDGSPANPNASPAHTTTGDLAGIGDEAYVAGGSMIMLRKGNTIARFTYISCPCNTDNIKPLAQAVASRL
jgi:hypothetical protein